MFKIMKKIVSFIIIFLFFFGLFSDVLAMKTNSIDISDFTDFSIEQIQNTFSNSLSQEKNIPNKTEKNTGDIYVLCNTDYNIPTSFVMNLNHHITNIYFNNICLYGFNCFCRDKLFDEKKLFTGIGEYKIKQNSYIATVLFDVANSVYIIN